MLRPRPRIAAMNGLISVLVGMKKIFGNSRARLYHKMSCTRTGIPRKNQEYAAAPPRRMGFEDIRIMATIVPITTARNIDMAVRVSVMTTPVRMGLLKKYSANVGQPNASLKIAL